MTRAQREDQPVSAAQGPASVFDADQAASLLRAGSGHWWYRSKAKFVGRLLRATGNGTPDRLVDLGAGTGDVTVQLRPWTESAILVEATESLARHAHFEHRLATAVGGIEHAPLREGSADVVTLLDVIEHFDDPVAPLHQARRLLRPGGRVVVNVPGHQWLWSAADEFLGHRRRYTRRMLRDQIAAAGFEVVRITHVYSWLVPPVLIRRRGSKDLESQLGVSTDSAPVACAARVLTAIESSLVRWVSLPVGTSVIGVGRLPG